MKTCTICHIEKLESEFFTRDRRTGRLHAQCKLCYKAQRAINYARHYSRYITHYRDRAKLRNQKLRIEFRNNMFAYMSDKACVICSEDDIRVLEFDHLDVATKTFNISQAVSHGHNWKSVLEEMQKCQILCANCHKKRTAQQFHWYKAV